MWPSDLQLPSSLAVPGKLVALVIHDAHVHEEVRPPLAGSVMQLLFLTQRPLTALQCQSSASSLTVSVMPNAPS